jgi:hypothetical protein
MWGDNLWLLPPLNLFYLEYKERQRMRLTYRSPPHWYNCGCEVRGALYDGGRRVE